MSTEILANGSFVPTTNKGEAKWFYNPAIDLIIGCGAWSIPLLLLSYSFSNVLGFIVVIYGLNLLINYPHYMATIYRAYRTREEFSKYRLFTLHLTVMILLTAVIMHCSVFATKLVFTLYMLWSPWHYSGQNFGLTLMFARRNGATPTSDQRNALYLAFIASYLMLFIKFNSLPPDMTYQLSLGIPLWFGHASWFVLLFMFLGLGLWSLIGMTKEIGFRAMIAPITLFSTQFFWFFFFDIMELFDITPATAIAYNGGILALMHCSQYLWITSYYTKRESQTIGNAKWNNLKYYGVLIIGGIMLFIPGPWLVSYAFKYNLSTSAIIFLSLVNLHHFLLDGAIWKLRDGRIAGLLLDFKDKLGSESVGEALSNAAQWLTSSTARPLRIAFIALLLVLAGLDQAKYYFGLDINNKSNLIRASILNPYDLPVLLKLGLAEKSAGNLDGAIVAMEKVARLDSDNFGNLINLTQLLIKQGRLTEANQYYKKLKLPKTADSLALFGQISIQLNNYPAAIESWQQAIKIDPKQNLYMNLADAYEHEGKLIESIANNEQYFKLLIPHQAEENFDPNELLRVGLKLSKRYRDLAELYAHSQNSNPTEALKYYQRSVALDFGAANSKDLAISWQKYALFLRQSGVSEQVVFACFLKAESLIKNQSGLEVDSIKKSCQETESTLGDQAKEVRQNLDKFITNALTLQL